ncbi:hypothetical protein DFAR_2690024 [Desulfarculales bacterium]
MYESLDKPALKPLPATAYQYAQYKEDQGPHRLPRGGGPPLLLDPSPLFFGLI